MNKDAFSNGQIDSKLWLCRELESLGWISELTHIYGGWHGILAFLLLSRERFQVKRIESFDQDPTCEEMADIFNNNWVIKEWQFKAHTADCNWPLPGNPDLIINTSTEHFEQMAWFDMIPKGQRIILQGNNLVHDDHFGNANSLTEFENTYTMSNIVYRGSMDFVYPDWKFTRYMLIGIK